ncbi:MAG: IS4 family transposase [bacterium]
MQSRRTWYSVRVSPTPQPPPPFSEKDLQGWQLVRRFQAWLAPTLVGRELGASEKDPRRTLAAQDYFSLLLFALFNPVVGTLRGLVKASALARVQREVSSDRVSLASFSEAQHLFDPQLLRGVLGALVPLATPRGGDPRLHLLGKELVAVDGSLFATLPRMSWALRQDYVKRGAKLHVKYSVLRQSTLDAILTPGKVCERKVLRSMLRAGELYVCDGYYGRDYKLFDELAQHGCDFVIRLSDNAVYAAEQERPLSSADRAAGVVWDGWVKLGQRGERVRLVRVAAYDTELLLATNRGDLAADLVGLIYRHRWQIELFFKWIKCILGCRHLLLESPQGVASQLYCACIIALLLTIATGRKPTKRHWELIQFHLMGWATFDELTAGLNLDTKKP